MTSIAYPRPTGSTGPGAPRPDRELVRNLFAAVDAGDADAVGRLVTDGVRFRFGNADVIAGRDSLVATSRDFSASITGVHHEITELWEPEPGIVVAELQVTYSRRDGGSLTLPCCNIFRMRDGLVDDYRIYMGVNPVFA
jgi:ketosteroid isomerase-like protein